VLVAPVGWMLFRVLPVVMWDLLSRRRKIVMLQFSDHHLPDLYRSASIDFSNFRIFHSREGGEVVLWVEKKENRTPHLQKTR